MLKLQWNENLKAALLGLAFFLLIVLLFVFAQDLSSSKFIYVDF
jgi:hypothetical protein